MSEEKIFDDVIQNYITEHTTTETYYTQKYVDEIKEERDKYKSVLNKIKEEVLTELQNCKPKDMAISMEINYIEEKLERLLEEIE